jgi:hypothetical protein
MAGLYASAEPCNTVIGGPSQCHRAEPYEPMHPVVNRVADQRQATLVQQHGLASRSDDHPPTPFRSSKFHHNDGRNLNARVTVVVYLYKCRIASSAHEPDRTDNR